MNGRQTFSLSRDRECDRQKVGIPSAHVQSFEKRSVQSSADLNDLKCPELVTPSAQVKTPLPQRISTLNDVLPQDTIKTLGEISQDYYRIRAFVKEVDGQPRTVVVAGECHLKNSEAFSQGEKLTRCFQYSGLEGLDRPRYWADSLLSLMVNGLTALDRNSGSKEFACDSTLTLASNKAGLSELQEKYAQILAAVIQKHGLTAENREAWNAIGKVDFGKHMLSMTELEAKRWEAGTCHLTGADIVRLAFELPRSTHTERQSAKTFSVFSLEKDHQKTLSEELGMAYLPAMAMSAAVSLTFLAAKFTHLGLASAPLASAVGWIATAVTAAAVVTHSAAELVRSRLYEHPWFQYLSAGPLGAIVNGRNRTFVSSITSIIKSHPEVDKLLVIVGRDHVAGVSGSLMKEHGWRELAVPGQKVGY